MSVAGESAAEEDDVSVLEDDDDLQSTADSDTLPSGRPHRSRATGRVVTIPMLMKEGFLEPGDGALVIEYLGQKFQGDLMPDGQIRSQETSELFSSPSSWAISCKKIVNPEKKSGCGWASVRYRGKKLDIFKNMLFKRRREREQELGEQEEAYESEREEERRELLMKKRALIQKIIVKHEVLGSRNNDHEPSTLVECAPFAELGKMQPFTVTVTSSTALTVLGFHSHLTDSEVVGYLAGRWDVNAHDLAITHAFPVRCRLADKIRWKKVEFEIFTAIEERKLTLVGWYHSHPHSPPTPTIRDTDLQLDYQIKMKGSSDASYTPCVGMIYTPFPKNKRRPLQSNLLCYWSMPPPELRPTDYPRPMAMEFTVARDAYIHQDALTEMRMCAEYYRGAPDAVNFTRPLADGSTNWERLKSALEPCVPAKHSAQIIEFFHDLLFPRPGSECPEAKVMQSTAAMLAERCSDPSLTDLPAHRRHLESAGIPAGKTPGGLLVSVVPPTGVSAPQASAATVIPPKTTGASLASVLPSPLQPAKRARTASVAEGAADLSVVDLSAMRRPPVAPSAASLIVPSVTLTKKTGPVPEEEAPQDLSAPRQTQRSAVLTARELYSTARHDAGSENTTEVQDLTITRIPASSKRRDAPSPQLEDLSTKKDAPSPLSHDEPSSNPSSPNVPTDDAPHSPSAEDDAAQDLSGGASRTEQPLQTTESAASADEDEQRMVIDESVAT